MRHIPHSSRALSVSRIEMSALKTFFGLAIGLYLLVGSYSLADATISIQIAEVQDGVATIKGNDATKESPITWDGAHVTTVNPGGVFSFTGVVPADCVGTLSDGLTTIEVAVTNCTPVATGIPLPVAKTGQTQCWDINGNQIDCAGTGQDGNIQAGVVPPSPRFTNNGDGTVTDNATGLIWLRDAACLGFHVQMTGFAVVSTLASGNLACGLTDGSAAGDWRVPNRNEFTSLMDFGTYPGVLPVGHPFLNFASSMYVTSTTLAGAPEKVWTVNMADGTVEAGLKSAVGGYVTAVRGPVR